MTRTATALNVAPFAFGGVLVVSSMFGDGDGPVLCPFRRCTGGYCPGCGGIRAVAAMLKGDLAASWTLHPWVLVIAAQVAVLGAVAATRVVDIRERLRRFAVPILLANMTFGVVVWIVRISAGSIPVPFAS